MSFIWGGHHVKCLKEQQSNIPNMSEEVVILICSPILAIQCDALDA